ncbi:hypothetical protein UY3_02044 [Chelonia mydas]|uniref:Myb/SANT-like DNA-binding domain-containing protein n=1 Tax=Chelonia mydas TaxID=8469 RepID=M7CIA7_CHEMY|nr:hypothetical protein UY3_02044 [Chelonia mydas]
MKNRGHNRDPKQCGVKLKELRQAYQKTREVNGCSGSEPRTCRFHDELHAILGGSATTTSAVLFDSFNGDGGNTEAGFGDEEEDDDEVVDSSQQASGETSFSDSQELFLTLDVEAVPPGSTQGCLPDLPGREGTSVISACGAPAARITHAGAIAMEPDQISTAVLTIVNPSHIIQQHVRYLQNRARKLRQRDYYTDEDMDTDGTACGNREIMVVLGQVHAVER